MYFVHNKSLAILLSGPSSAAGYFCRWSMDRGWWWSKTIVTLSVFISRWLIVTIEKGVFLGTFWRFLSYKLMLTIRKRIEETFWRGEKAVTEWWWTEKPPLSGSMKEVNYCCKLGIKEIDEISIGIVDNHIHHFDQPRQTTKSTKTNGRFWLRRRQWHKTEELKSEERLK